MYLRANDGQVVTWRSWQCSRAAAFSVQGGRAVPSLRGPLVLPVLRQRRHIVPAGEAAIGEEGRGGRHALLRLAYQRVRRAEVRAPRRVRVHGPLERLRNDSRNSPTRRRGGAPAVHVDGQADRAMLVAMRVAP